MMTNAKKTGLNWHWLANPARFGRWSRACLPFLGLWSVLAFAIGLYYSFFNSPPDYQQGESVRILYIHVPAAWMTMLVYTSMAVASSILLVWKHPLAGLYARAVAPIGAMFTAICLATGSIWGKPTWGTWWVWDARLTSVLVMFFIYLGHIALSRAFDDAERGDKSAAVLTLVGLVNAFIVKFSVDLWYSLHQSASISMKGSGIDASMLPALLWMSGGYLGLFITLAILRTNSEIGRRKAWIKSINA